MRFPIAKRAWFFFVLSILFILGGSKEAHAVLLRGQIVLHNVEKTRTSFVESRMDIQPNEMLTFEKLKAAEIRLLSTDLFTRVEVRIDMPKDEAAQRMYVDKGSQVIDIHVTLDEKTSWVIFPNASFGSGDRAGGLVYADQNLVGRGMQLLGAVQYGEQSKFVFAGFRVPKLASIPLTYAISAIYRLESIRFFEDHKLVQEVDTRIAGGEAQIGWVYSSHFKALFGVLYHNQAMGNMMTTNPTPLPYNPRAGNIVALQLQMLYDDTIAPEGLRKGVSISLRNEQSDAFWGSDFDYMKTELLLSLYGYFKRTYPSALLKVVLVYPTSDRGVPLSQLVRTGGPDLRGYLANEFRGDTLITLQLEEAVRLLSFKRLNLAGAIFADAGAVLERHPGGVASNNPIVRPNPKLSDFHTSIGAGLRILIPGVAIPAVRLDFAYGFDVQDTALVFSVAKGGF